MPGPVVVVVGGAAIAAAAGYATLNHLRTWADGVATDNGYPNDANGGGAFRHALVSAELTRIYGEDVAKFLGDLNEAARPANYDPLNATDRNQDLTNNKAGRDIGKTSTSEQDSINKVKNATDNSVSNPNNGPLVIDHNTDPRVEPENFPNDLIPWPFPDSNSTTPPVFPIGDANNNGIPDIHESGISPDTKSGADGASQWQPRRDPLTFDLDGDGLETTGTGTLNPIYFDQDGDGIKTSSGWVKPDDAFLVLDKNGNGTVDSGRELFGDSTIKSNGQTATDGFDALADLDSNADGIVNASDASFNDLRIWRDLNQDGISQTAELFTLSSQNIIGIYVAKTANSQTLPNGNQIADKGTFIRADGTTGELDAITGNMADINLAEDTFHRQFPDVLDTTSVATLPDMQGSGKVRDLREAATQSTTLQTLLTNYSAATTRAQQAAQIDQLLDAWADTGGLAETMSQRVAAMTGYTRSDGVVIPYTLTNNLTTEWQQKLHIIETFNGAYFFGLPGTTQTQGARAGLTIATPNASSTSVQITVNLTQQQLDLLQQSYDAIKSSVYDALLLQTRFKPVLDQINLVIDANGINLDFSQVNATFETKITANAALGMADLIEFNRSTKTMLADTSWQGYDLLEAKLRTLPITPDLQAIYDELHVTISNVGGNLIGTTKDDIVVAGALNDYISGDAGDDIVYAGAGIDNIYGGAGDDILYGQDGNDYLSGDSGNDVLKGGAGDDQLNGGLGNDTYLFNLGDGQDIISNNSNVGLGVIETDQILLGAGITTANVKLSRDNNNRLVIEIVNTTDKLTINNYFTNEASTNYAVQTIKFADGTTWSVADVKTKVLIPTASDDRITGYVANDNLSGLDGNDYLIGNGGNDTLDGGMGADTLDGGLGDDSLTGGAGYDVLYGGLGNNTLDGGSENDNLQGNIGNDTLSGGSQNDTLYGDAGNDSLNGGSEDDILYGGADDDDLQGSDGNDTLYGDTGNDTLNGGLGNDLLNGGDGLNTYIFTRGDGQDTIDNSAAGRTDILSLAANILTADVTLVRVADDLEVRINNSTDKVTVKNHFTTSTITLVQFNNGTSWNQYTLDSLLDTSATAGSDVISGRSIADNISGLAGLDVIYGYGNNDTISGGDGADILYGGDGYDTLTGDADTDTLYGDEGNDTLDGGTSNDTLIGGNGNDTYIYNLGGGIGSGVDTIEEVVNTSTSIDKVNFGAGITASNTTYSKTGNDLQFRFNNYDYLIIKNFFLTLDDQYKVEQFVFADGTVWSSQNIQGLLTTPTLNNDVISGYEWADNVNGLDGNDWILGNGGDDTLIGGQGYDNLNGGAGNDLLDGGIDNDAIAGSIGNDTLIGGAGNDTLAGEAGDDVYQYQRGDGFDTISDSLGSDLLLLGAGILPADVSLLRDGSNLFLVLNNSEISMQLQNDQIETIQFQNGTVWNLATIQANTVFGAVNTFTGTAGNDNYTVDNNSDVINELANQGTDSVTSSVTYYLGANIENLTLTGFLSLNASGNTLDNVITGNSGNNLINGGGFYTGYSMDGADVLIGGAGNDVYFANNGDVVTELVGGGIDTIYTNSSGYVMQDNVENLIIVGEYQYYMIATGNALNNVMQARGNWYNQVLDGGLGADTMSGGYDTTFYVDNIGDVVGGSGNYKVYSSVDFTLAAHLDGYLNSVTETLILTGSNATKATGNDGKNALDGRQNSAANILEGGAGDDTYYAGANDIIIEQVGGGNDTLSIYASYTGVPELFKVGNNIENLVVSTANTNAVDLEGSDGDNNLSGNNGLNNIKGLDGNDTIYGGTNGGDTLDGGDGNDSIYGNGRLYGGAGDDSIGSAAGAIFTGGTGNDSMAGNAVDTYIYVRGDGSDTIRDYTDAFNQTSDFRDKISFGVGITESDILLSSSGDNLIISIAGTSDTITVEQHFVPDVGTLSRSIELLQFENGATWDIAEILVRANNTNSPISENTDYVIGTSNNDLIKTLGGNDYVIAGDGDDTIEGGAGNDTLLGKSGIDVLVGGLGDDTLQGGISGDTYKFGRGAGTDLIIDAKNNLEIDSILLDADIDPSQIIVRRSSVNYYDLILSISDDPAQITIQNFYFWGQENSKQIVFANGTVWNDEQIRSLAVSYYGTSANDVVNGTDTGSDKLFGLGGDDTLNGLYGSDTLDGGLGADAMFGATGDDRYIVDNAGDAVTESVNEGYDTVESSITYTLGLNIESLVLTGNLAINGTGNTLANYIVGNTANNVLDGGTGIDEMLGGLGDDVYLVDNINDIVYENQNEGVDTVQSKVTYTLLSADIENLTLTGTSAINGTGNSGNNVLTGNGVANRLTGADGHDTLEGGAGIDTLVGGLGDDTYIIDVATDVITEAANAGTDTVVSAVTYALGSTSNLENLYLTGVANVNATGNALNNEIEGNSGNNIITGGAGNDSLYGGLGVDTLIGGLGNDNYDFGDNGTGQIDNTATDNATAIDTLYLSALPANVVLSRVVSDLVLTINTAETITIKNYFAAGDSKIDQIVFGDESVWNQAEIQSRVPIVPTTGDDNLTGTSGNDIIDALAGNDTVFGSDGNDQLLGNAGNDSLDGGLGLDTLTGGAGNDIYVIDNTGDVISETSTVTTEIDEVKSSISYILGANLEKLTLTGTVNLDGTGNTLANTLTGNNGNNILDGGTGTDTLIGGLGDDTYIIDVATDVITEAASVGIDTVKSAITYVLGATSNLENLTLTGTSAINGTGNTLANVITGNAAANTLNGGTGADTMIGGAGNDIYTVDNALDVITENLNEGSDRVNSSIAFSIATFVNVENLTLTGSSAINATGNTLDNVLTGNTGNNSISGGAGNDTIDGGTGNDTMTGGAGNDVYFMNVAGDVVNELANEGTDTINSAVTLSISTLANIENITLTGSTAINATGNTLANVLTGNTGNNSISGGAGNDTIDGGTGNDTMVGGAGNDVYFVNVATDVVTEIANEGTDTVNSAVTYSLASLANIENVTLTGSSAINATGNALANVLTGNSGNNILTGGTGADTLTGGLGADTFDFNAIAESLVGSGRDLIADFSRVQLDKIDLSTIDANSTVANDQAFSATILTSGAFTAAGQLRLVGDVLSGNTDSNFATSEVEIQLTGVTTLAGADFIL